MVIMNMQNAASNFESLSEEDFSRYAGKWIAIVNSKVIASGLIFKEVYESAKKSHPKERALIGKVPENHLVALSIA